MLPSEERIWIAENAAAVGIQVPAAVIKHYPLSPFQDSSAQGIVLFTQKKV